jgi:hypothetical protein
LAIVEHNDNKEAVQMGKGNASLQDLENTGKHNELYIYKRELGDRQEFP